MWQLPTVRNSLHLLYYYLPHTVLWILASLCEVLQLAPVMRTRCFPLRRCFYATLREAGRVRPGRTRLGSYRFHVILQEGVFNCGGAASESRASLSVQQQCAWTCAHLGYWHLSSGSRWRAAVLIMGDVQSTQRGSGQDAAAEEESRDVDHPQTELDTEHEVGPRSRTVLFSKVMPSCVTEVLRWLVLRANTIINQKKALNPSINCVLVNLFWQYMQVTLQMSDSFSQVTFG